MDDFSKPKIVWGEISDKSKFAFDFFGKYIPEATTFYMKGEYIEYLLCALNSSVSEWLFSKVGTTTGVGTVRWKKYTIEQFLVGKPSKEGMKQYMAVFEQLKTGKIDAKQFESFCNTFVYQLYRLSKEEVAYIEQKCAG